MKTNIIYQQLVSCVIITLSLLFPSFSSASGNLNELISKKKTTNDFSEVRLFAFEELYRKEEGNIRSGQVIVINKDALLNLFLQRKEAFKLMIPLEDGSWLKAELALNEKLSGNLKVIVKGNSKDKVLNVSAGLHYYGILEGNPNSYVSVSVHEDSFTGVFSYGDGNLIIQKLNETDNSKYLLYNDKSSPYKKAFLCNTSGQNGYNSSQKLDDEPGSTETTTECKVVKFYLECDYKMYDDIGDINLISSFMADAFNSVATIYLMHNIFCEISELVIWNSPDYITDLYPWNSISMPAGNDFVLSSVVAEKGSGFNGDLSLFITTRTDIHPGYPSGIATTIGTLCNKYLSHALVVIGPINISENISFPNYSDFVQIIAHESGHLLGSHHTQWCGWQGGPIDNCAQTENDYGLNCQFSPCCSAGPTPISGTIMSYCSFVPGVGVDFNNGFGIQPGDKLYDIVLNAECLTSSLTNIPQEVGYGESNISWGSVPSASTYNLQYRVAVENCDYENRWTTIPGITSTTSIPTNTEPFTPGVTYIARISSDCSDYSNAITFTTELGSNSSPTVFETSGISSQFAILAWERNSLGETYLIRYKKTSSSTWTSNNYPHSPNYLLFQKYNEEGSQFEWQVRTSTSSPWSGSNYFTLMPDDQENLNTLYCSSNGDPTNHYINSAEFTFGAYLNNSGANIGGYGDFNDDPNYANGGDLWHFLDQYDFDLYSFYNTDRVFCSVFIDFNRDGDFTDPGEDIVRKYGQNLDITPISGTCVFPEVFYSGWTNMRISYSCQNTLSFIAPNQCSDIGSGEVEDYLVYIDGYLECESGYLSSKLIQNNILDAYPNPSRDYIFITNKNSIDTNILKLKIVDVKGQIIMSKTHKNNSDLDISSLNSGIYTIIIDDQPELRKKIIIVK